MVKALGAEAISDLILGLLPQWECPLLDPPPVFSERHFSDATVFFPRMDRDPPFLLQWPEVAGQCGAIHHDAICQTVDRDRLVQSNRRQQRELCRLEPRLSQHLVVQLRHYPIGPPQVKTRAVLGQTRHLGHGCRWSQRTRRHGGVWHGSTRHNRCIYT